MTQSVELTLDDGTDRAVRALWAQLAEAGLPTEQRPTPIPSHRPHVTLVAAHHLDPGADAALPGLLAGLDLSLRVGGLLVFGPRRGSVVLARQVVVDRALLDLQGAVATLCGADPAGHFGPGRWTPHLTLARRVPVAQLSAVVQALGDLPELAGASRRCRRWDSEQRTTWELTGR
ncbi:2'-5' RNA ligase [Friedmanniella luteola]|uniref:2'-5' RNA ligase n=1 Tax=Friedmanniella luteola TaxID=546871 RepID=A0A1H1PK54_9ACTN|nr:2'-5' RNA ligase family protein [Friedmanniella luteola]SDS11493.1 2'-5' RNA ligase [Friedmanniella luteola]